MKLFQKYTPLFSYWVIVLWSRKFKNKKQKLHQIIKYACILYFCCHNHLPFGWILTVFFNFCLNHSTKWHYFASIILLANYCHLLIQWRFFWVLDLLESSELNRCFIYIQLQQCMEQDTETSYNIPKARINMSVIHHVLNNYCKFFFPLRCQ